jgi:hypothetical protein
VKPLNLPPDLIREWAKGQTAASAKLEGRELPEDYVRSEKVEQFLQLRAAKGRCAPSETEYEMRPPPDRGWVQMQDIRDA